jgi:hypothetical protein
MSYINDSRPLYFFPRFGTILLQVATQMSRRLFLLLGGGVGIGSEQELIWNPHRRIIDIKTFRIFVVPSPSKWPNSGKVNGEEMPCNATTCIRSKEKLLSRDPVGRISGDVRIFGGLS